MRILAPTFFGTAVLILWAYAIFDIIATEATLTRNLPKTTWLIIVFLAPGVGAVAWLALGRPLNAGWAPGDTTVRQRRTFVGPEDRDDWKPPPKPQPRDPARSRDSAWDAHPVNEPGRDQDDPRESLAAKERRLMEWEAELARRESGLTEDQGDD